MRTTLLILAAVVCLTACGGGQQKQVVAVPPQDCIEVLYFHGVQRCPTCVAIEKQTKEVVEITFAEQIENGDVVFKNIDITQKENEALADRYEVTWSSLFVNGWVAGEETANNLTEFAFANARTNPEKFKAELTSKINELLLK